MHFLKSIEHEEVATCNYFWDQEDKTIVWRIANLENFLTTLALISEGMNLAKLHAIRH